MNKFLGILAALIALALPSMAQEVTSQSRKTAPVQNAQIQTVALGAPAAWQDRDDERPQADEDRDRRDRDDRDRDRHKDRNDRDRDRDWDRDRDRDRGGYYGNNGGYYGNGRYGRGGYHGVLAPEWQQKFDSYYQRWLNYRATNNRGEMRSMEKRMQDIMIHYNIPSNVPYDQVASPGIGGYNRY